jgi:hypothetical protein
VSALEHLFQGNTDDSTRGRYLRSRCFHAFLRLRGFDHIGFLTNFLATSQEAYWRISCCRQLSAFRDPRAVQALCAALLSDEDPDVRFAAAEALGEVGDATALEALERAAQRDTRENFESRPIAEVARTSIERTKARLDQPPLSPAELTLERFGELLIGWVRDPALSESLVILSGNTKNTQAQAMHERLQGLSAEQTHALQDVIARTVDDTLHRVLRMIERDVDLSVRVRKDTDDWLEVRDLTDALSGKLDRWVEKFSKRQ